MVYHNLQKDGSVKTSATGLGAPGQSIDYLEVQVSRHGSVRITVNTDEALEVAPLLSITELGEQELGIEYESFVTTAKRAPWETNLERVTCHSNRSSQVAPGYYEKNPIGLAIPESQCNRFLYSSSPDRDYYRQILSVCGKTTSMPPLDMILLNMIMHNVYISDEDRSSKGDDGRGPPPPEPSAPEGNPPSGPQEKTVSKPSANQKLVDALKKGATIAAVNKAGDKAIEALLSKLADITPLNLQGTVGREASKLAASYAMLQLLEIIPQDRIKHRDKIRQLLEMSIEGASGAATHELAGALEHLLGSEVLEVVQSVEKLGAETLEEIPVKIREREYA